MDNPDKQKLHFVIVGGSLGGLGAGLALKSRGHNTTILERNPTPLLANQGAGIVAGGDTLEFFKRYNRCDRPIAVSSKRRLYLDQAGAIIHQKEMTQNMTSWDLAYYLMRANYDGVQSAYCEVPPADPAHGKAEHLHDHQVTDLALEDDPAAPGKQRVRVSFKSSSGSTGSLVADAVVGADGPSSTVRAKVSAGAPRSYAGYCALRGTVPEREASAAALDVFRAGFVFFHGPGVQILAYLIPGEAGATQPGERLVNFVYYTNFPDGSAELDRLMTDRHGARHNITMPPGLTDPAAWEREKDRARRHLPPQFAELVCKTGRPFVQAVTDAPCPDRNEFWGGKVVLVGDALAGFRPHTVASTSQAAFDAMGYADFVDGKLSRDEWRRQTMGFARFIQQRGIDMGNRSQFADLPVEELIKDRDRASVPRKDEVYPEWATALVD